MIPSGYKEDVVYSQIPTDGAGDLSFTRASNGTRINSAGLVEVVPWNLYEDSENFSVNALAAATITSNTTTAPNGTTTADSLVEDGTNNLHAVYDFAAITYVAGIYTLSCYVKKGSRDWVRIQLYDGTNTPSAYANVNTGVLGVVSSGATASIESVGDGWYRVILSATMVSAVGGWAIYGATSDGGTTYQGVNGSTALYLWGIQCNIGSTAKPYFPTTDRLNVPRLTYQNGGGGCPSLLLEKQSTNLVTYSEQFDNAAWTKQSSSITANATTSPDGTQNADKFIASNSNGFHAMYQLNSVLSGSYTLSVYAKKGEYDFLVLHDQFSGTFLTSYNLSTGAVHSGSGASIENVGNGWYRCIVTFNGGGNTVIASLSPSPSGSAGTNYQGDGTSGIFIWGFQIEASSYATSYIPTTSASATRVADVCNKYSISSLIGQTEGTIFGQLSFPNSSGGGGSSYVYITDGSFTNSVVIGREPATPNSKLLFYINAGGSNVLSNTANNLQSGFVKMAIAYKSGDWAAYLNGTLVASGTSTSTFSATMSRFGIGTNDGAVSTMGDSMIASEAILFPTRLTNAELASLTTI